MFDRWRRSLIPVLASPFAFKILKVKSRAMLGGRGESIDSQTCVSPFPGYVGSQESGKSRLVAGPRFGIGRK